MIRHSLFVLALIAPPAQPQVHRAELQLCIPLQQEPPTPPLTFKHREQGGAIVRSPGGIT